MIEKNKKDLEIEQILSIKGRVSGIVADFNIDNLSNEILEILKDDLKNAKGIIINFEIHPSVSLHLINNVMQTIENTINPNCKVILNTISSTLAFSIIKLTNANNIKSLSNLSELP
jgi:cell division GTPase FtsZ